MRDAAPWIVRRDSRNPEILEAFIERSAALKPADSSAPLGYLEGYAAVFGVESALLIDDLVDADGDPIPFVEMIDPHAFDDTLRIKPDVKALYNHDPGAILGRTTSGTLALNVDATGLGFLVNLPNTQVGRDAKELVGRRDVDGCSFGFSVVKDRVEMRPGLPALRTLLVVDLFEVTPCTAFPAYGDTSVSLRASPALRARDLLVKHRWERERLALSSS